MYPPPPHYVPSQMGLDRGPPPPGHTTPCGRCYLDGAALPLLDKVEEIGVASHGLQESLISAQQGGGVAFHPFALGCASWSSGLPA